MNKRYRMIAVLLCMLMLAAMAAGCGKKAEEKLTAQSLLQQVQDNTAAMKSMEAHADIDMVLGGDALSSIGGTIPVSMEMDMQTVTEPLASHVTAKVSAMMINTEMETYTITDGEAILNYIQSEGQWMLQKIPYNEDAADSVNAAAEEIMRNSDSMTLAEETKEFNGKEVYILTGTIEGEDVANLMGEAGEVVGSFAGGTEDIDFSGISVDVEYAISAEERLPVYTNLDFHGMDSLTGVEDLTIDTMTMKLTYTGFNTVESITVPQEAIDNAQEISAE